MSSQPSSSKQEVDEATLLDWGARIGVAACMGDLASSQMQNLIASLDSVSGREGLLATVVYALKQLEKVESEKNQKEQRKQKERNIQKVKKLEEEIKRLKYQIITFELVKEALIELFDNKSVNKDHVRKMLDFAKWVYEANLDYNVNVSNIDEAIKRLKGLTLLELLKQHKTR